MGNVDLKLSPLATQGERRAKEPVKHEPFTASDDLVLNRSALPQCMLTPQRCPDLHRTGVGSDIRWGLALHVCRGKGRGVGVAAFARGEPALMPVDEHLLPEEPPPTCYRQRAMLRAPART